MEAEAKVRGFDSDRIAALREVSGGALSLDILIKLAQVVPELLDEVELLQLATRAHEERWVRGQRQAAAEMERLRQKLLARDEFVARAEAYWGSLCLCGHARRAHGWGNLGKGSCRASTVEGRPICMCDDFAIGPAPGECDMPPAGWWRCTRSRGHPGPCAAVPR